MAAKRTKVRIRYDVYLSGPLSSYGNYDENVQRFATATAALRQRGYRVFSPPENEPTGWDWVQYLRSDLQNLVACKFVVVLPNWNRSKGARLEVNIAKRLAMPVVELAKACEMRPR